MMIIIEILYSIHDVPSTLLRLKHLIPITILYWRYY